MKLKLTKVNDALQFAGDLDIYHAEVARDAVRDALLSQPQLTLDLGGVTACDTSGLQLLLATCHSATATGKPLHFRSASVTLHDCCRQLGIAPETIFAPAQ